MKLLLPLRTENWKYGDTRDIRDENNNRISYDLPKDVAEFFVTACNAHEGLLELAAKGLYDAAISSTDRIPNWGMQPDHVKQAWRNNVLAEAAIAQAKAGEVS